MGIAILSGVLSSLEARLSSPHAGGTGSSTAEPPSGISTPTSSQFLDAPENVLPSRFIATVGREETARKLRKTFVAMGQLGAGVEVVSGGNADSVAKADVILVW